MVKKILRSLADLLPQDSDSDPLLNDELLRFFFLSDPNGALRLYLDSIERLVDQQTQFAIAEELTKANAKLIQAQDEVIDAEREFLDVHKTKIVPGLVAKIRRLQQKRQELEKTLQAQTAGIAKARPQGTATTKERAATFEKNLTDYVRGKWTRDPSLTEKNLSLEIQSLPWARKNNKGASYSQRELRKRIRKILKQVRCEPRKTNLYR